MRKAALLLPDDTESYSNLGSALRHSGHLEEAVTFFRRALQISPEIAGIHANLANTLKSLGRLAEAEASYRRALLIKPDYLEVLNNLGNSLKEMGRFHEAEACFRELLILKPDIPETLNNLGNTLKDLGRLKEADVLYQKALEILPDFAEASSNRGNTLKELGEPELAEICFRHALEIRPEYVEAWSNRLLALNFSVNNPVSSRLEHARSYGRLISNKVRERFSAWKCTPTPERLRIGFVSGDLRTHPVGHFLESILAHIDPSRLELIAYPTNYREDELTSRIRPRFSGWKSLVGKSDESAARLIHSDGINILLDLSGHTGNNRLPVFAWKPAPLQATWLGYFATTGVAEMDYILVDETGVPPGQEGQFTEKVAYLPDTRLCFTPPDVHVDVSNLPALSSGWITFGCFQSLPKTNEFTLKLWGRIFAELPPARLHWQCQQFCDQEVVKQALERLAQHGIAASRVRLVGAAHREAYLASYNEVDLVLDTFPHPGGTTTCEALWMGVPTLTLAGDSLLSRQGASLMMVAGLPEWVATEEDEYVEKAVALAGNLPGLASIRMELRRNVLASPLFDAPRFARNFENLLWKMWEQWQECSGVVEPDGAAEPTNLEDAVEGGPKTADFSSDNADLQLDLGNMHNRMGRFHEAVLHYRRALELRPDYAAAYCNLGATLNDTGYVTEAEICFLKALEINPDSAETCNNLGNCLKLQGRLDEAKGCYLKALAIRPSYPEAHNNLGIVLHEMGRFAEAEESYRRALESRPDYAEASANLGITLSALGRTDEEEATYRRALLLKPDHADVLNNLGSCLNESGRLEEAEVCLRRAITVRPDFAEAHCNLGVTLNAAGRLEEAEACYRRACEIKPDYTEAYNNLSAPVLQLGRRKEAEAILRRALEIKPDYAIALSGLLATSCYTASHSTLNYLEDARRYGKVIARDSSERFSAWNCTPAPERLRIGFVSGDLRTHPVGHFLESILAHIDPSRLEIIAYPTNYREDELTSRIRPRFSSWKSLVGTSDEAAARLIHSDGINILLDLSGHTGNNRLPVFAWNPAPLQATWLGYFATTGVAEMDYILVDETGVPPGQEGQFTEKVAYLPDTRLCFTPPDVHVEVARLPALSSGRITFGCFQNLSKITDDVVSSWSKVLSSLPNAQLRLQNRQLGTRQTAELLARRLQRHGIDPTRVTFFGGMNRESYLASHAEVDVILDTFPFPGGTTTCEALWMGVPTLTLAGNSLLTRQGASLMKAAGLPEWVAEIEDEYVMKAVNVANDLPKLAALRSTLRQMALASPLFDASRFARNFEELLWKLWRNHTNGNG
ncbi:MAG TPA: tetratricopeptide repeat protein [Desulfuromonadales bacterium]|nr:tetratricopeptide repeat protein [Desulfuromonadales bacterium]